MGLRSTTMLLCFDFTVSVLMGMTRSIDSRALSFSEPLLSVDVNVGSRALSFSGPLLSLSVEFCVCVCVCVCPQL